VKRNREEPTVVDHYTPTSMGDLNHPNATLGVAIESESPRFRTQDESFTITTEMNPFGLRSGESKQILRLKEAGEVISIEIISDNPFLQVHLELDDYRSNEGGTTAAELLQVGRTGFADMEFSAKKLPSGDYSLTYAPRINTSYSDSFKLKLTNSLTSPTNPPTATPRGDDGKFKLKGNLPSLSTRGYIGGSFIDIPHIEAIPTFIDGGFPNQLIHNALARALNWDLYDNKYSNDVDKSESGQSETDFKYNTLGREHVKTTMTTLNPYTGEAGRISLGTPDPILDSKSIRIVFFPKGTAASTLSQAPTADLASNNDQQIAIYAATSATESAEDETAILHWDTSIYQFGEGLGATQLWIRDRGRFYFPGTVHSVFQYKTGLGDYVVDGSGNGGVILLMVGGLDFVPEKIGVGAASFADPGPTGIGTVTHTGLSDINEPHIGMIIRSVIVKRKRKRSLV
jgi:hypothetical protein